MRFLNNQYLINTLPYLWAILVEQEVYLVLLTAKSYMGVDFFRKYPLLLLTSTPDLKCSAFFSKILNRNSNIGTKGMFLNKFCFPTRMRTMQNIHINDNKFCRLITWRVQNSKMTAHIIFFAMFWSAWWHPVRSLISR